MVLKAWTWLPDTETEKEAWIVAEVVANEPGYKPLYRQATEQWAKEDAEQRNLDAGLTSDMAYRIVASSMNAQREEDYDAPL